LGVVPGGSPDVEKKLGYGTETSFPEEDFLFFARA